MLVLSEVPTVRQIQLRQLIITSQQKLKELTAPVLMYYPWELRERKAYNYDTRELVDDYIPPSNRFATIGNHKYGGLNFD
jgi:hypothetical protein